MEKDLVHFNGETSELVGNKVPSGDSQYKGIAYSLNRNKLSLFFIRKICVIIDIIFFREKR